MLLSLPPIITLSLAIICEVFATSWLPKTNQFTALPESLGVLVGYGLAFYLLSITVQSMSLGVAYAVWCGAGIVLVAAISWLVYGQKLDVYALVGIGFILTGTAIINIFSSSISH
ncbi:multidrug efflux SMR transporter [Vibrio europaeus]|uniref:Multidrug efflux SMR transporter n=1 Tax=Vibrio europaeus TaxID=300876 RepID=A0AAE7DXU3_9VIBR|nr:multidrug efflux SMR transporter [Vibrio europaeus]MDC5805521.1 multidrug efflux SMR transporter [Vibrio europaeus]MDC5818841.1 multidrug efflux SMR transporter [Vibrio europaeus]MDC5826404.1 multidrug efflux SMR transporter [Vibrio europaeus]MDC5831770.1 multidrug efflux SMR transporter [Vibrio europaeus]MDC5834725.1 multidrug efflux SMR transporter [Vibrio europaeus]